MGDDAPKVICPHCGEPNPKSLLVTTCQKCLGSLEEAQPAPGEAPASAPPTAEETTPVAEPSAEVRKAEPFPAPAAAPTGPAAPPRRFNLPDLGAVREELARQWNRKGYTGPSCAAQIVVWLAFVCLVLIARTGDWRLLLGWVVIVIGAILVYPVARAIAVVSTYEVTTDPQPDAVPLGSSVTWGVVVEAKKPFILGPGRIVLQCYEHYDLRLARPSRNSAMVHEESQPLAARYLEAGETAELRASLSIPASAIPSYEGEYNSIGWTAFVEASVPGICPNIREQIEFDVLPWIAAAGDRGSAQGELIPANWLERAAGEVQPGPVREGPLWAKLSPADADESDAVPAVSVGSSRQLNLTLEATEDIDCRAIRCRVCCRLHGTAITGETAVSATADGTLSAGSFEGPGEELEAAIAGSEDPALPVALPAERGETEEVGPTAAGVPIHVGPLLAGQTVKYPITLRIPPNGPVSYRGLCVNFDWFVQVNVDIPSWFDKHVKVPFVVTPRLGPERGAGALRWQNEE